MGGGGVGEWWWWWCFDSIVFRSFSSSSFFVFFLCGVFLQRSGSGNAGGSVVLNLKMKREGGRAVGVL